MVPVAKMVFSTAPLDIAGGLAAIRPFVHRLLLFLKKKSEKKKVTEKLFNALKATERMDKAIERLEASGKTFRETCRVIEAAPGNSNGGQDVP